MTLLERPLRKLTLISAARTALRARARQFEIRDYIDERTRSEEALRSSENAAILADASPEFPSGPRVGRALGVDQSLLVRVHRAGDDDNPKELWA